MGKVAQIQPPPREGRGGFETAPAKKKIFSSCSLPGGAKRVGEIVVANFFFFYLVLKKGQLFSEIHITYTRFLGSRPIFNNPKLLSCSMERSLIC